MVLTFSPLRLALRATGGLMAVLLALTAIYGLAAWIGSSLPYSQRADGQAAVMAATVPVYVETNGVHTGIIVPIVSELADFSAFVSPAHARDAPPGATHMLVGWGHAGVYRNTPRWQDLRLSDAASAVVGSNETLLHVTFIARPTANAWQRRILVSPAAFRLIARRIGQSFVPGGAHHPGYGDDDVFYQSVGRYSAIITCNEWTGSILRDAGVTMGRWTPFAGGVMKWLPEPH